MYTVILDTMILINRYSFIVHLPSTKLFTMNATAKTRAIIRIFIALLIISLFIHFYCIIFYFYVTVEFCFSFATHRHRLITIR